VISQESVTVASPELKESEQQEEVDSAEVDSCNNIHILMLIPVFNNTLILTHMLMLILATAFKFR